MLRQLLAAALHLPAVALAGGLEAITLETACYPEHGAGEFGWMLVGGDDSSADRCVFAQFPQGDAATPFIRSNGVDVKLRLTSKRGDLKGRWQVEERFASAEGQVRVRLRYRLARDSCEEVQDGCCGQEYRGILEVFDGPKMRTYQVKRWSGS